MAAPQRAAMIVVALVLGTGAVLPHAQGRVTQVARTTPKASRTSDHERSDLRRATAANSLSTCTLIVPPDESRASTLSAFRASADSR